MNGSYVIYIFISLVLDKNGNKTYLLLLQTWKDVKDSRGLRVQSESPIVLLMFSLL